MASHTKFKLDIPSSASESSYDPFEEDNQLNISSKVTTEYYEEIKVKNIKDYEAPDPKNDFASPLTAPNPSSNDEKNEKSSSSTFGMFFKRNKKVKKYKNKYDGPVEDIDKEKHRLESTNSTNDEFGGYGAKVYKSYSGKEAKTQNANANTNANDSNPFGVENDQTNTELKFEKHELDRYDINQVSEEHETIALDDIDKPKNNPFFQPEKEKKTSSNVNVIGGLLGAFKGMKIPKRKKEKRGSEEYKSPNFNLESTSTSNNPFGMGNENDNNDQDHETSKNPFGSSSEENTLNEGNNPFDSTNTTKANPGNPFDEYDVPQENNNPFGEESKNPFD